MFAQYLSDDLGMYSFKNLLKAGVWLIAVDSEMIFVRRLSLMKKTKKENELDTSKGLGKTKGL